MTTATGAPLADPKTSALDLIVQIGEAVQGAAALRASLRYLAGALHLEGALSSLATMADARLAAATITEAAWTADDPVGAPRIRTAVMRVECVCKTGIADPDALAQALYAAAIVLELL